MFFCSLIFSNFPESRTAGAASGRDFCYKFVKFASKCCKVNSVQEPCAKCFAVHKLKFEILQRFIGEKLKTNSPVSVVSFFNVICKISNFNIWCKILVLSLLYHFLNFKFTWITGCSSRWRWFIVNRWRFVILRGRFIIHCRWRFITNNRWSRWCSLLRLDARWRWWWFSEKKKADFSHHWLYSIKLPNFQNVKCSLGNIQVLRKQVFGIFDPPPSPL